MVYLTSMRRADSALALAALHSLEGLREARVAAISVTGSGLAAAAYCDAVSRFYNLGPAPNSNRLLPVGLTLSDPLPADPPMTLVGKEFPSSIRRPVDTAEVPAQFRNSLTFIQDNNVVVVLSGDAAPLAQSMALAGTMGLVKAKVKLLVVVDSGEAGNAGALRQVLADWPGAVVLLPRELGEAVPYPAVSIENDFTWAPRHPIVEAYRAYRPMPYDAPSYDLAAMVYAVRPESGMFKLSEPGAIQITENGSMHFAAGGGTHRRMELDPVRKEEIRKSFIDLCSAKPVVRRPFRPPSAVKPPPSPPAKPKPATP